MKLEEAKAFMWKENDKNPSKVQWSHHKTIRDLHDNLVAKIYADFKLELETEYKRGQDSILSRSCKSCKHKYIVDSMTTECRDNDSPIDYLDLECFPEFSCNKWKQK